MFDIEFNERKLYVEVERQAAQRGDLETQPLEDGVEILDIIENGRSVYEDFTEQELAKIISLLQ